MQDADVIISQGHCNINVNNLILRPTMMVILNGNKRFVSELNHFLICLLNFICSLSPFVPHTLLSRTDGRACQHVKD